MNISIRHSRESGNPCRLSRIPCAARWTPVFTGVTAFLCMIFSLAAHAAEPVAVRFCRPNNAVSALAYIAEHEGYFTDANLGVSFLTTTNAKLCNDNLSAGHADVMFGAEGPFSWMSFNDHPVRLVAQAGVNPETTLIARRDAGIVSEADIRGKRIGYLPGTVSYLYLVRLLDKLGLTMKDVTPTAMQPPAMPHALQGGAIDAFVMWEPWADQAVKALGDKAVRLPDSALYTYKTTFGVTKDFAVTYPETVQVLLQILIKAESFIKAHPDEAIAILSEAVKLDADVIRQNWKDYDFTLSLGPDIVKLMEDNARYIIRDDANFAGKAVPDYRSFIDPQFLKAVAPERVTLQ